MQAALQRQPWEPIPDAWDAQADPGTSDNDSDSEALDGEAAGEQLAEFLFSMLWSGKMSAKTVCVIAWWATKAGAKGSIKDLAFRPSAPTGHFQRKIDSVCGTDLKNHSFYMAEVPGHSKCDYSRTVHEVPVRLPHEVIDKEISEDPDLAKQLAIKVSDGSLPPSYHNHPVVSSSPDPVMPLAFFLDGVVFNKRSSMLAIYLYNTISCRRHMLAAFRKSELCHCGCRGWCTLWVLFDLIRWSFECCANKLWPTHRHDGKPWKERSDNIRSASAGIALRIRSAILYIKGDWAEFAQSLALSNWRTKLAPCWCCLTTVEHMYDIESINIFESPWTDATHDDWEVACQRCEQWVQLTPNHHAAIKPLLMFDRRKNGSKGRALTRDYEPLGLLAGDRLEPCENLKDVAMYEDITIFPILILFWRVTIETRTRHRCPLFLAEIGITIDRVQIDMLHTIYLGTAQDLVARCLLALILIDAFGVGRGKTEDETIQLSVLRIRAEMMVWYREQRAFGVAPDFTPLEDFQISMVGEKHRPAFKSKAAECKTILPFIVALVKQHAAKLRPEIADSLVAAGEALLKYISRIRDSPAVPTIADCQARPHKKCNPSNTNFKIKSNT